MYTDLTLLLHLQHFPGSKAIVTFLLHKNYLIQKQLDNRQQLIAIRHCKKGNSISLMCNITGHY